MKKENTIRLGIAEDFYEDFGNNLTRLQVLSEILERKTREEDVEGKQLIGQIKDYLASLWLGIRDMLWALSDTHHTVGGLVTRISQLSMEIFRDNVPSVLFLENKISNPDHVLPPHYCLNILIIFKELMQACSKYPGVSFIRLKAENTMTGEIILSLLDTADYELQQYLENKLDILHIKKCAGRLGALFSIDYSVDEILICRLIFIPSL